MPQAGLPGIGPDPAPTLPSLVTWAKRIRTLLDNIMRGKTNNTGTVTLATDAPTTTLSDPKIGGATRLFFTARTAEAATEAAGGLFYLDDPGNGSVVINHSDSPANCDFDYIVVG